MIQTSNVDIHWRIPTPWPLRDYLNEGALDAELVITIYPRG
jgi:hypothetical protein